MYKCVEDYLEGLRNELAGSDPAIIQDALTDAEEHLRTALEIAAADPESASAGKSLDAIIEQFGSPGEIASAYRGMESRFSPEGMLPVRIRRSSWMKFFGVMADPRAWSACLYMLMALPTGIIYGMWGLYGGAFSFFSLIFIIGLPITGVFLLSVRGIALMEGRIAEALLNVRMPRKPLFVKTSTNWKSRFMDLVKESHTWKSLIYLLLQLPLGSAYGVITAVLFSLSLKSVFYPLWYLVLKRPLITLAQPVYPPAWTFPLIVLMGCLLLPLTLHFAKGLGKIHGRYAKAMLVRK